MERRITKLEGGLASLATSSGMSAISTLATTLVGPGETIVSGKSIFGGTYSLFSTTLKHLGIKTIFVPSTDPDAFAGAIDERCRMVFVESISNPAMDVPDIAALAEVTRKAGVPLVVDNTVTTPYIFRPAEFGADLVIHSTTKFITGHGVAMGGIMVDCGSYDWSSGPYPHLKEFCRKFGPMGLIAALRQCYSRDLGACQAPMNAFLQTMTLESLAVRMDRHCSNALALAHFLAEHPAVKRVGYPGLADNHYHQVASRQFGGKFGAILTLELENKEQCFRVIDSLKLASNLANLGEVCTLVIHPSSTIYQHFSEAAKLEMGVSPGLIRVCVGLEHIDDIIEDFSQALDQI